MWPEMQIMPVHTRPHCTCSLPMNSHMQCCSKSIPKQCMPDVQPESPKCQREIRAAWSLSLPTNRYLQRCSKPGCTFPKHAHPKCPKQYREACHESNVSMRGHG